MLKFVALGALLGGLAAGGLVTVLILGFVLRAWWSTPFEVLGFGGPPEQPIPFPHPVHTGIGDLLDSDGNVVFYADGEAKTALGLDCTYCHRNVDKGASASVPPVEQCIFCHKAVQEGEDNPLPGLANLLSAWENKEPVVWERVHRLPDSVRFVHEAHIRYFTQQGNLLPSGEQATVAANVCSTCHGDVAAMAEVQQVRSLKMGDCLDCHRDYGAPTDCTTCHY